MTIEHFVWQTKASSQPTLKDRDTVRTAQFGDGYEQISDAGMNDETLNYGFSFIGEPETVKGIYFSLRCHKTKPSSLALPGSDFALWCVEADSLQRVTKSKTMETVSATFGQAFAP